MKSILLYDIDGTLLNVNRRFMASLLEEVLDECKLDTSAIYTINYSGRTDSAIFRELIGPNTDVELFDSVKKGYLYLLQDRLTQNHVEVITDAVESLLFAEKEGLSAGLCTGNFREAAQIKLRAAGIDTKFEFGGFGCLHSDRNELPALAHKEFVEKNGREPVPADYVVIGDTPNDIRCARHFGARAVAVTTGHFSHEELTTHQPDAVMDSLLELQDYLKTI
jgi:phosphoglycolate phosphatase-like HAD superfamily hydrolase